MDSRVVIWMTMSGLALGAILVILIAIDLDIKRDRKISMNAELDKEKNQESRSNEDLIIKSGIVNIEGKEIKIFGYGDSVGVVNTELKRLYDKVKSLSQMYDEAAKDALFARTKWVHYECLYDEEVKRSAHPLHAKIRLVPRRK